MNPRTPIFSEGRIVPGTHSWLFLSARYTSSPSTSLLLETRKLSWQRHGVLETSIRISEKKHIFQKYEGIINRVSKQSSRFPTSSRFFEKKNSGTPVWIMDREKKYLDNKKFDIPDWYKVVKKCRPFLGEYAENNSRRVLSRKWVTKMWMIYKMKDEGYMIFGK